MQDSKSPLFIRNSGREVCAEIKRRISIPWLWQHHNLPGAPKPGRRCSSPFYQDKNPDFFISRDGVWFVDHGESEHKGDVIRFEMLASGCTRSEAIRKLRALASFSQGLPTPRQINLNSRISSSVKLRPMSLDFMECGSSDDLRRLADLRCLAPEALEMARNAGVLRFGNIKGSRAWILTDKSRCLAEARRLDGQRWKPIDAKSWTLPGSCKKWPLGILEAQSSRAIALVEGAPDFLAAFHWIWAENKVDVAPVAMLGASLSIHPVGLSLFAKKRVRIFPHYDAGKLNGFDAARRWEAQLRSVHAVVDCFDGSGLLRNDGQVVSDLNDLCSVEYEQWQNELRAIMP